MPRCPVNEGRRGAKPPEPLRFVTTTFQTGFCLWEAQSPAVAWRRPRSWAAARTGSTASCRGPREPAAPPLRSSHLKGRGRWNGGATSQSISDNVIRAATIHEINQLRHKFINAKIDALMSCVVMVTFLRSSGHYMLVCT